MKKIAAVFVASSLVACTTITTSAEFKQRRESLSISEVCRTLVNSYESGNYDLYSDALSEAMDRGQTYNTCKDKVSSQNAFAAVLAVATVAAVAVAANKGNSNSGAPLPAAPVQDYDWAWDEFYNEYRQLVWACRGKQTAKFAPEEKCMFKMKNDFTWPSKEAIK